MAIIGTVGSHSNMTMPFYVTTPIFEQALLMKDSDRTREYLINYGKKDDRMKVLIAGCGGQGGSAGGHLIKEKDVEGIVCTDMDMSRAKRLADRLKDLNKGMEISTEQVDFSKPEDLARVAKGVNVVFNACFPVVNLPILKACIEVGAHYVDAASFPIEASVIPREQTMDGLLDFDDQAKSAGITALSNMGRCPGIH